jgi:hypothetical protein
MICGEGQLYAFLNWALDRDEWSSSDFGHFTSAEPMAPIRQEALEARVRLPRKEP